MEETRIVPFDRRRWQSYGWLLFVTLLVVAGAVYTYMVPSQPHGPSATDRWFWIGGYAAFWLACTFSVVDVAFAETLLTEDRIELRTLVTRRSIPWDQVAGIEEKERIGRGGSRFTARIIRMKGRPVSIPGFTAGPFGSKKFDQNLETVHAYWARVTDDR
ncbi:PH domain-containing protein [Streptacidiphilus albus]|uniref:PH domain-containing protein n=1 Tax=Streptacidiphilus albus TaxID=105425 RepID=UPI00054C7419|nr:PH domain-containing protein [Streptacidiphilus albus]